MNVEKNTTPPIDQEQSHNNGEPVFPLNAEEPASLVEMPGDEESQQQNDDAAAEPLYSIFTKGEKTFIVVMASLAALFSPLTANIYYPALGTLAADLHVSNTLINLTITTYLIFQGLAPTLVGSFSDTHGRRPAYLLTLTIYLCANIGLSLQNSYPALLCLRMLQSSGSSGTVALASAVVSDVVTTAERGSYMGYAMMGGLVGPAVGPVIGGLLDSRWGWRAIFWFLVAFAGVTLAIMAVFFPETGRAVVGNGSTPPQWWNRSALSYIRLRRLEKKAKKQASENGTGSIPIQDAGNIARGPRRKLNLTKSITILFDRESGPVLLYAGILFAGFYMVMASLSSQLAEKLHFNTLQIGLMYIPLGVGAMGAAIAAGKFLDWNFRRHARKRGLIIEKTKQQDLRDFPIERARLEIVLPLMGFSCLIVIAYGWVIEKTPGGQASVAGLVVLLLFMALGLCGTFQGLNTLVVDLNRASPGSATAAMNLTRCLLGAGGVALVGPLIDRIGNGWMAVLVAGVFVVCCPLVVLVMRRGPGWREEKRLAELGSKNAAGGSEEISKA